MPGRDRTGPEGMGAMTGLGAGYCGSKRTAGGIVAGRGWQCGGVRGGRNAFGGRGRRNMFYATGQPGWRSSGWDVVASPELEAQALENQAAALEEELAIVKKRLADVEKDTEA
ncbi:hypothetical protein SAMN02745165_01047 [Malonomonas rubra DSM 5091]|uniref:DUF5320 domain-containing protein n=1 Tax=Malonomonas rubra DSM 5091 TaxID=1122189 RepID=A0A1M6EV88_MALRU|nr:DUF5320 domain-containing protein [Malonomonas rubra]SHI89348.1 hypothetical protein SAMN02745165_01047 [Malonomonas rubra DSM 5091]